MVADFPRILALLRKERKISQKQAAQDLKVGQALLSHYEKGNRECGLEFLVRAADYYGVSTDYLLGRAATGDGADISAESLPEPDLQGKNLRSFKDMPALIAKRMLISAIEVIYSLLSRFGSAELTRAVGEFFGYSVYTCFRLIYRANPANEQGFFSCSEESGLRGATARRCLTEAAAIEAGNELRRKCSRRNEPETLPAITTASLEADYGKQAAALMNFIKTSEKS